MVRSDGQQRQTAFPCVDSSAEGLKIIALVKARLLLIDGEQIGSM